MSITIFGMFGRCCSYGVPARCQFYNGACGRFAALSVMVPSSWSIRPLQLEPRFACADCYVRFLKAWRTPIKGIDRPADASEDWQPSLMDMIRHARIAIEFKERDKGQKKPREPEYLDHYWKDYEIRRGFTPAQIAGFRNLRALMRKHEETTNRAALPPDAGSQK